jgi:hypothetical protein
MKSSLTESVINTFVEMIKADTYTIGEMCNKAGVSERSYLNWRKENSEFAEIIKKAEEEAIQLRLVECRNSLVKLINGQDIEEVKTVYYTNEEGERLERERTVIQKTVMPNLGAIIHYQTNKDPDNWKNRQTADIKAEITDSYTAMMKKVAERRKEKESKKDE